MLTIRPPQAADRPAWDTLYQGYAQFYQVTQTAEVLKSQQVLLNPHLHEVRG